MKPIMAGASCDLLALCLSAASLPHVYPPLCVPHCSQSVHFSLASAQRDNYGFITELRSLTKWMNRQTEALSGCSLPLYSKLALTCARAAFMAPPWIWCKDHSLCRIMAETAVWETLLTSQLRFHLLGVKTQNVGPNSRHYVTAVCCCLPSWS